MKLLGYVLVLAAAVPVRVSAQTAAKPSLIGTWTFDLKQGPKKDGPRIENATIPAEESVAVIWRAITKYNVIHNDMSPQMLSFQKWVREWSVRDSTPN